MPQCHQHAPNIRTAWIRQPESLRHLQHHTNEDDTSTASTHHTMATTTVPTVGSTLGGSTMSPEVALALTKISHTQNALMLQLAALSVVPPQKPPNQITITTGNQFTHGGGYHGQGGGAYRGQQGGTYVGQRRGGCNRGRGRGSFAQATQNNATSGWRSNYPTLWRGNGNANTPKSSKTFQQLKLLFLVWIRH